MRAIQPTQRKAIALAMKLATGLLAVGAIGFAAFAIWVHGKSRSQLAHNSVVGLVVRSVRFRNNLLSRHPRCTVADAWRLSSTGDLLSEEDIRSSFKIVKTDGKFVLVQTPIGEFWMPSRDTYAAAEMIQDEREGIYQLGSYGVRAGDVVLDCGANIGVFTRYALSKGASRVVAIEVAPEDVECLRRNLVSDVARRSVTIYPKGVWDKDAVLQLRSDPSLSSMANSVALAGGDAGPIVPLTTIDKIVAELNLSEVDFIKMDIEGAESNALHGALQTVAHFRPRLAIALEHHPTDPDTIPKLVHSQWPFYNLELSSCAEVGSGGHIQPNVLFARSDRR